MIKTIITMLIVIIFMSNNSYSEGGDSRESLRLGAKIGANYSNVYDTEGEEFDAEPKFGLAIGVFAAIPLGLFMGLQPEIIFSQKGFQGSGKVLGSEYSFSRTTSYIDVPLLFALKPNQYMTVLIGPQYSFLLKQHDTFNSTLYSKDVEQEFNNENLQKNILGFIGGVDINFEHFILGARFGMDFMNNVGDGTTSTPRYKNVWGQLTLGIDIVPFN